MDVDRPTASSAVNLVKDSLGERCQKLFQDFLLDAQFNRKYLSAVYELVRPERNTLTISFDDIELFSQQLANTILQEYLRVYPYLCRAVKAFASDQGKLQANKEFHISFVDVSCKIKVRELKTSRIGSLIKITGQVIRTHPVHPELVSASFVCLECQTLISDVLQQFKFTQPTICRNPVCNNRSKFLLDISKSKFVDFQKVRIQETQAELPRGTIPRSIEVILRGEAVETAHAGDKCDFIGTLIVVPDISAMSLAGVKAESGSNKGQMRGQMEGVRGLKSLGVRDLNYRLAFLGCSVESTYKRQGRFDLNVEEMNPENLRKQMTEAEWKKIYSMSQDKNLYQNLCDSLFPTIHGSTEVKRGVLLMLFGGVLKMTLEGTRLRGDINVCIVGDPSTAKSQVLKQVEEFCPRSVYTSGKASTAAGLTAAVVKDEESHEFVIEAGALMLSDNGVCCIDEFDKMDLKDQVAIHEAMEQQTISITKAGVKATLNARTSILAAANPIGGKYDRSRSLRQNIMMSAPIMSRFDLFFILIDECNEIVDYAIARRIVSLHQRAEELVSRVYTVDDIQRYITFARLFEPKLSKAAMECLIGEYKKLRLSDMGGGGASCRVTVRQLESMIRLSEAYARLHCQERVEVEHVKEAFRLLSTSIIRVEQPDIHFDEEAAVPPADRPSNGVHEAMDTEETQENHEDTEKGGDDDDASRPALKVTFDEYKQIASLLVIHLRRKEEEFTDVIGDEGVTEEALVDWYLNEIEAEIETEDELISKKKLIERVIKRLVEHDHVLIKLTRSEMADGTGDADQSQPIIVVHPNYVLDL